MNNNTKNKKTTGFELLERFCSCDDERLATPFFIDDWACATNGHLIIRIPLAGAKDVIREAPFGSMLEMNFFPDVGGEWRELPRCTMPEKIKCRTCYGTGFVSRCPECYGDGEVVFDNFYNCYEIECRTCRGNGYRSGGEIKCNICNGAGENYPEHIPPIKVNNLLLNPVLLEKIKDLPGVKLFFCEDTLKYYFFNFDGGHGALMPMTW